MRKPSRIGLLLCLGILFLVGWFIFRTQPVDHPRFYPELPPTSAINLDRDGGIIVFVSPCTTVTPVADYRALLEPGIRIFGQRHYINGYPPAPIATLPYGYTFVPPAQATIIYEPHGECATPTP